MPGTHSRRGSNRIYRRNPAMPGKHNASGNMGVYQHVFYYMEKITVATALSSALVALTLGFAGSAFADAGSGSNVPNPAPLYPQMATGGANPYTPYGVDPYVPYGVWSQH
jgi:hypothetical protein